MIQVRKDEESGEAEIFYDDETVQGSQFTISLDDKHGLEVLAGLCKFYQAKGYNVLGVLQTFDVQAQPVGGFWAKLKTILRGK